MENEINEQRNHVTALLQRHPQALVALSGGVDSALLAVLTKQHCRQSACVCVRSCFLPAQDYADAVALAETFGLDLHVIDADPLADNAVAGNPEDRCYFCKNRMVAFWQNTARQLRLDTILCGDNADDRGAIRPGKRALNEHGIACPFDECDLGKDAIRQWAKELGIPVWNKPPSACLASRIPFGTRIDPAWLRRIDTAETALKHLGLTLVRIRALKTETTAAEARIETDPALFALARTQWDEITACCQNAGFSDVSLDPAGYRCGSLHQQDSGKTN